MPLVYNGTNITKVIYNGTKLTKVVYNGVTVFGGTNFRLANWKTGLSTGSNVSETATTSYNDSRLTTPAALVFAIINVNNINGKVSNEAKSHKISAYGRYGFNYYPMADNTLVFSEVLVDWSSGHLSLTAKNYASPGAKTTPTQVIIEVLY